MRVLFAGPGVTPPEPPLAGWRHAYLRLGGISYAGEYSRRAVAAPYHRCER